MHLPASGSLPENALELLWRPSRSWPEPEARPELHVYKLLGGWRSELPVTISAADQSGLLFRVVIDVPVAAGSELTVESTEVCPSDASRLTSSLQVGPAAPAPTRLGTLEVDESGQGMLPLRVTTGQCYLPFSAAYATLRVELSDAARPFAGVLRYGVRVDGAVFLSEEAAPDWQNGALPPFGESVMGRGKERIYHVCGAGDAGASQELAAGAHRVQMFAQLPDGRSIDSDEISVELRCDGAPAAAPGAAGNGGPPADAEIPVWIEAEPKGSGPEAGAQRDAGDAGAQLDAGDAASAAPPGGPDASSAGWNVDDVARSPLRHGAAQCSPLLGAGAGRSVLWATFLLLVVVVTLRTKRRLRALGSTRQSGDERQQARSVRA
jgi:hypothetical protein